MWGAEIYFALAYTPAQAAAMQAEAQRSRAKAYRDLDVIDVEARVIPDPPLLGNSVEP